MKKKPVTTATSPVSSVPNPPEKKNRGLMGRDFSRAPILKAASFISIDDIPSRENYTAKRQQALINFIKTIPENKGALVDKGSEISGPCLKLDLEDLQDEGRPEVQDVIIWIKNTSMNTQDVYLIRVGDPLKLKKIREERALKLAERQKRRAEKLAEETTERDLTRVSGLPPEAKALRKKLEEAGGKPLSQYLAIN